LAIQPNYVDTLYNRGVALDSLGNHIGAIADYDKALAIQPNNTNALNNKGVAFYDLHQYYIAIISYDKILRINPNDVSALNNKANALAKLGKKLEAIQYYQRAIKLIQPTQSSNATFTYYHITPEVEPIYTFVSENQPSTIRFIQATSSGQNQKIVIIKMNLAEQYVSIKDFKLAIITYSEILHDDPYNGCALLKRADALKNSGQLDQAANDEKIGNMLKPTCHTGGTNVQKTAQPSPPDLVVTFAKALFH
jgi:tetratricopeptide (TPR) repeat protein